MPLDLTSIIKPLGWSVAGVCNPQIPFQTTQFFQHWLQHYKGPQLHYLERRQKERLDPKAYFPQVQSILCFGRYYFPGWAEGEIKVSNYTWGKDYHQTLRKKLEETVEHLKKEVGDFEYRICVDTSPVLEKILAVQAGLGWQGKNSLLLNARFGSFLFLGEIFTTLPLSLFQLSIPSLDHCGNCNRCIEACPTHALEPYRLNAEKCISYWTLEHKGPFTSQTPPFYNWLAGCDICQEVCPWNQKLIPIESEKMDSPTPEEIQSEKWLKKIQNNALSYAPPESWKRNLEHMKFS